LESTANNGQDNWHAFKQGDENAFAKLYQSNVKVLYAYGFKLLPDRAVIEDLVQDIFIELWQKRETLSDVTSPQFYLFKILRRRIFKSIAKNNNIFTPIDYDQELHFPIAFPKEFYIIEEENIQNQKAHLYNCIKNLPIRQYEVMILRFYQDLSYTEIAKILTINEQSVRNLIQRAVLKLRQLSVHLFFSIIFIFFIK
tara:strand:+ start:98 stop:691 length:594 start_codon:yes stop_codon:yes gene_type:complete